MAMLEGAAGRTDDLNEGRIWSAFFIYHFMEMHFYTQRRIIRRLPMARTKPYAPSGLARILDVEEEEIKVDMPSAAHQQLLIDLYFLYVHPSLPVIHKATFLKEYEEG